MKKLLFTCMLGVGFLALCGCGSRHADQAGSAANSTKPPRADLLKIPDELSKSVAATVNQASLDIVNEVVASQVSAQEHVFHAKSDAPLWFRGWAYDESKQRVPGSVWIELTGKISGLRILIPATRMERRDVATGFKAPWALMSGFASPEVRDHNIPPGTYDLKVYQIDDQTAVLTKYYETSAVTVIFE